MTERPWGADTASDLEDSVRIEKELSGAQLERLLEVGRSIVSELDLETVLRSVLNAARDLTGARYAAIGVLDEEKNELERFVFVGIDEDTRHAIGALPRGKGVLGELIRHPEPLRLPDVGGHQHSYGFPANHPPMKTFLGTPVVIRGEAWGNLYLTEKAGPAEFSDEDENVVVTLAAWAAVAIENARLYADVDRRQHELERAVRGLEMSSDIATAAASGLGPKALIELISKRARSLLDAEVAVVLIDDGGGFLVAGAAGAGAREWLDSQGSELQSRLQLLEGHPREDVLQVELPFRGRQAGQLIAISRSGESFDREDLRVFQSYAINAATTMASVRSAEAEKLKLSIESAEEERRRWARELHDQTLQELGALRFLLETASEGKDEQIRAAAERALTHVDRGIQNLQGLITELRPSSLDELGAGPALEALARDADAAHDATVELTADLSYEAGREPKRLVPELESAIYRLTQESLNNALKHASPTAVQIEVTESDGSVTLRISDDGVGFDPTEVTERFGLVGMRERVDIAGGELRIESKQGEGTVVTVELPVARAEGTPH
jgi:signal transduction histidine kinase